MKKGFILLTCICCSFTCNGDEYIFLPSFTANERYEDNLRLQPNKVPINFITTLSPALKFGYLLDNGDLEANFKANQLLYDNESNLDATETILDAKYGFIADRFTFTLDGNHSVQSSITTELTAVGSGILTNINVFRTSRSFSPSFGYKLTENNTLQTGYSFNDVEFDDSNTVTNGLIGFTSQQLSSSIIHRLSERQNISLSTAYSLFEAPQSNQSSKTTSIQIGWQYIPDEQTQFGLSIGKRITDSEFLNGQLKTTTDGQIFSANLSRSMEWGNISINLGQQLNPASTGQQQQSTTISASTTYNINERLFSRISGNYLQTESVGNLSNNNSRTFSSLSPSLNWRWSEDINLEFSYTYRQQNFNNASNRDAVGNTLRFQFSYQPKVNKQVK
ncbi:MAG: hypothetical protein CTY34_07170 [Methylobacter sp.]|nr:MAG: hypothetical protein CTY34_07170 [Methylobacter sp.]PPD36578.1 MAG: hypothetical protein CTY18_04205 [Methylomonas sp.]